MNAREGFTWSADVPTGILHVTCTLCGDSWILRPDAPPSSRTLALQAMRRHRRKHRDAREERGLDRKLRGAA